MPVSTEHKHYIFIFLYSSQSSSLNIFSIRTFSYLCECILLPPNEICTEYLNEFQACQPAAQMALDDVNRKKNILPGYTLRMHSNDSQVTRVLIPIHL